MLLVSSILSQRQHGSQAPRPNQNAGPAARTQSAPRSPCRQGRPPTRWAMCGKLLGRPAITVSERIETGPKILQHPQHQSPTPSNNYEKHCPLPPSPPGQNAAEPSSAWLGYERSCGRKAGESRSQSFSWKVSLMPTQFHSGKSVWDPLLAGLSQSLVLAAPCTLLHSKNFKPHTSLHPAHSLKCWTTFIAKQVGTFGLLFHIESSPQSQSRQPKPW